jgi:hypothetical protein
VSSKIVWVQRYDLIEKRPKYKPELLPSRTLPEETRVGTYTQNGNSVHIELSAYEIEAKVQGNSMEGSITFNLDSRQKDRFD